MKNVNECQYQRRPYRGGVRLVPMLQQAECPRCGERYIVELAEPQRSCVAPCDDELRRVGSPYPSE